MDVEAVTGARAFLERAGTVLLADEARHNLGFGILSTARAHPDLYPEVRGYPTSNAINRRIGYERACESRELAFVRAT